MLVLNIDADFPPIQFLGYTLLLGQFLDLPSSTPLDIRSIARDLKLNDCMDVICPMNFATLALNLPRVSWCSPWAGSKIDKIAGIEARGFIIGGAIAHQLSAGFVPIRKKSKLPHKSVRVAYSLEYGIDEMEMHEDAVAKGERVILVDDLIATGGTRRRRGQAVAPGALAPASAASERLHVHPGGAERGWSSTSTPASWRCAGAGRAAGIRGRE